MAAKMPGATSSKGKRRAKADDLSEKDEFHLPQIVSRPSGLAATEWLRALYSANDFTIFFSDNFVSLCARVFRPARGGDSKVYY